MELLGFLLLKSDANDYISILKQFLLQYLENMKKSLLALFAGKLILFKAILLNGIEFPNSL